ncbi:hypothetical protein [Sorangium cellulosum]|uniref:PEGA domain-containing protein n=1 Tax=Sorangium cellulosum So0157-2 TaxID=1254432 RepID=S4XPC4_SORCE|nr:hypothetical protein [Sorangium cellulosum]AGP33685.1 hypothetical protein SCE1572_03740 [Sorangium cellulosum So0157-2]
MGDVPSAVAPSGTSPETASPAELSPEATAETIRRAEQARRAGRWEEAAAAYRVAWASTGDHRLAGELGLAELSLRRYRDAAEHLRRALEAEGALAPDRKARIQQGLRRAAQEVAAVAIVVGKPEAEVFVDGRRVGQGLATYVVYVEPGSHEARATLAGHEDGVGRFEAQRGDTPAIGLALKETPKPPAPRPAAAPPAAASAPGPAAMRPAGEGTAVGPAIRVGGLALASAGVVVGAGFAFAWAVKDGESETLREQIRSVSGENGCSPNKGITDARCPDLRDAIEARDALGLVAVASLVASGVIGAAALSSFWWAPAPDHGGVRVVPRATAHGGGVRIEGAW